MFPSEVKRKILFPLTGADFRSCGLMCGHERRLPTIDHAPERFGLSDPGVPSRQEPLANIA